MVPGPVERTADMHPQAGACSPRLRYLQFASRDAVVVFRTRAALRGSPAAPPPKERPSAPHRPERTIAQARLVALTSLRALDDLAGHDLPHRVFRVGKAKLAASLLKRRRHDRDPVGFKSGILQQP